MPELNLPAQVTLEAYDQRDQLFSQLAAEIAQTLQQAIDARGQASLAVSGGSSPIPLFQQLSRCELAWSKVTVTLVDERWVPADHADSNARLVRQHLLQNAAAAAHFIGLWQPQLTPQQGQAVTEQALQPLADQPLDLVILGMGNDGHTASLFPCSGDLPAALDSRLDCAIMQPGSAPHCRITLTPQRLLHSHQRVLLLCGEDKITTLTRALQTDAVASMPIRLFLQQPLSIHWAP